MKEGKVKRIDELVGQVLRQMGLEQRFKEQEVCEVWAEVVGHAIASRTDGGEHGGRTVVRVVQFGGGEE